MSTALLATFHLEQVPSQELMLLVAVTLFFAPFPNRSCSRATTSTIPEPVGFNIRERTLHERGCSSAVSSLRPIRPGCLRDGQYTGLQRHFYRHIRPAAGS